MVLKKGAVMDSITVRDSINESFALFLPNNFEVTKKWPVIFVFDMQSRGKQALSMMATAAQDNGYILAASNTVNDSLSLSQNVLITSRMFKTVFSILPIQKDRVYTAGFSGGARIASIMPTFLDQIRGVITCGSPITNTDILTNKKLIHIIGIVGNQDFNYHDMINVKKRLDIMKIPNQILQFEGGHKWPSSNYLSTALEYLDLMAMRNKFIAKDTFLINRTYKANLLKINKLVSDSKPVHAFRKMNDMLEIYKNLRNLDSLRESRKILRRSPLFKTKNRIINTYFTKELLKKDDFDYYLQEDVLTYNYNNLGWWKYQMVELERYQKNPDTLRRLMGIRLEGYINALVDDNIDLVRSHQQLDEEALNFLWMLKTITAPDDFSNYLNVISINAKVEDFSTSLFYLEELLKMGYKDTATLYSLEHTALLRITPEFNALVSEYLKESRYEIKEE